jgi:hypothetical protein
MDIFKNLETALVSLIKKKLKLNSLSPDNIKQVCEFQEGYLRNLIEAMEVFEDNVMLNLRDKYFATPKRRDRIDNQHLILDLKSKLSGKAGLYERNRTFGAALKVAKDYLKIMVEIRVNAAKLLSDKSITIDSARITDVMVLGVLREVDVFVRYTSYLWEYFRMVIEQSPKDQDLYRARYLADNQDLYFAILNNVCDRQSNYSFMVEARAIKRKNADLVLYANGNSFFPVVKPSEYNDDTKQILASGILGLNFFAWVVSKWDEWKHTQYKKMKVHKEWLEQEQARLRQIVMDADPNSSQVATTEKYIEAYSAKITELDREISEYEKDV